MKFFDSRVRKLHFPKYEEFFRGEFFFFFFLSLGLKSPLHVSLLSHIQYQRSVASQRDGDDAPLHQLKIIHNLLPIHLPDIFSNDFMI